MDQTGIFQDPDALLNVFALGAMTLMSMTFVIGGLWAALRCKRMTEETRREIAAYVAEGTISPDDAERILRARPRKHAVAAQRPSASV